MGQYLFYNLPNKMAASLAAQSMTLLAPALMVLGIITYFGLAFEPNIVLSAGVFALWLMATIFLRHRNIYFAMLAISWLLFGFVVSNAHTAYQQRVTIDPVIRADLSNTKFLGGEAIKIASSDADRRAVIFKVEEVDGNAIAPFIIRLTDPQKLLRDDSFQTNILPFGCKMVVKARVTPLPLKSSAASYDIGRDWYFKGYRASGQFLASPLINNDCELQQSKNLAQKIKENFVKTYPPEVWGMVLAMVTGERSGISGAQMEQYRQSGLIHLISISGVHMGLIAGMAFLVLRLTLVLARPQGDGYLFKKMAAAGAILIVVGYFLLADYSSASLRATLMTLVFFVGVILGRRAISLENLAIAMVLVLCYSPSDIFNPGFQLSFAAMLVLVGLYEKWWHGLLLEIEKGIFFRKKQINNDAYNEVAIFMGSKPRRADDKVKTPPKTFFKRVQIFIYALLVSGAMITLAGLPITLFHFHQSSLFGIVANMVAIPLMDVFAMPLLFVKVLLLPITSYLGDIYYLDWLITKIFQLLNWLAVNGHGSEKYIVTGGQFGTTALFFYGLWLYLWLTTSGMVKNLSWGILGLFFILAMFQPKPWLMVTGLESSGRVKWLARFEDTGGQSRWVTPFGDSFVRRLWVQEYNIDNIDKTLPPPSICTATLCQLVWKSYNHKNFVVTIIRKNTFSENDGDKIIALCQNNDMLVGQDMNLIKKLCPQKTVASNVHTLIISPSISIPWLAGVNNIMGGYRLQTIVIKPRPWLLAGLSQTAAEAMSHDNSVAEEDSVSEAGE